ncbi:GNAT family N-acetyltransferase [Acetobacter fallax]|uniref:GNAT family N-acetyltransferase n=1 Tax=Acetobacter fallax TaxID=1737473 RepID=A0ABX0KBP5_9PROT|nr:GNAT family N-acetyltransferase [Acetobacter fallax]NHO31920.1 GNAT family N-acetyltransferase [Acetobacter fallax]NHO35564.1 GNAT family N-acetyltransferase [Acetobacter fallax]
MSGRTVSLHAKIADIPVQDWDACAGDDNPFTSHAFLSAVEDSGSATPRTGWLPQYVVLRDDAGRIIAVAPAYLKSHSYGEYVFDHAWARAFENAGGAYYPKLQVAVPFSPAPGARLLVRPDAPAGTRDILAQALAQVCDELDLSSTHVTFCNTEDYDCLAAQGWLKRLGMQYHWHNRGYDSFDAFLEALSSRKRKALRRERRDANSCGLVFRTFRGSEITEALWDAFFVFYHATVDRKWGQAYLTRRFFSLLSERLGDKVVLMIAEHDNKPVAGALNLLGRDTLYGRNWGCVGDWPFLHFELCYYRAIDFAIEHGLARVEAGAQGEHKIQRGYLPALTFSAHLIRNVGLRDAVSDFLDQERPAIMAEAEALLTFSPYRQEN